jgi:hypothetical protein
MRGIEPTDFKAPRGSIEYGWGRLSCLSHELAWRRNAGEIEALDGEMLDRYASNLDNIAAKRQSLEADMAQYRQEKSRNPFYDKNELRTAITSALRKLYILLGCAVRLKASPTADINTVFRLFGFVLGPSTPPPGNQDLMIVGLTVISPMSQVPPVVRWATLLSDSCGILSTLWSGPRSLEGSHLVVAIRGEAQMLGAEAPVKSAVRPSAMAPVAPLE